MATAILSLLALHPQSCLMTGDRLETDVQMGIDAGMASALTLTGATTLDDAARSAVHPNYVVRNIGELLPE